MAGKPRYQVVPAGRAESPLKDRSQAPRQGNLGAPPAWLLFEPEVTEGIRDLRAGTEIMVLTWLDRSRRDVLVTRPGDNPHSPPAGVFSTRPPGRPNPIGLHRVRDHGRRITGSRARPGSARWDAACRCENRYWTKPPDDSDIAGTPCPCPCNAFSRGYTPPRPAIKIGAAGSPMAGTTATLRNVATHAIRYVPWEGQNRLPTGRNAASCG
jgi:hypothetical protein